MARWLAWISKVRVCPPNKPQCTQPNCPKCWEEWLQSTWDPNTEVEGVEAQDIQKARIMYQALEKIAGMEEGEHTEPFSSFRDITLACDTCLEMKDIAKEALKEVDNVPGVVETQ